MAWSVIMNSLCGTCIMITLIMYGSRCRIGEKSEPRFGIQLYFVNLNHKCKVGFEFLNKIQVTK